MASGHDGLFNAATTKSDMRRPLRRFSVKLAAIRLGGLYATKTGLLVTSTPLVTMTSACPIASASKIVRSAACFSSAARANFTLTKRSLVPPGSRDDADAGPVDGGHRDVAVLADLGDCS
jgi:hypothetical protein